MVRIQITNSFRELKMGDHYNTSILNYLKFSVNVYTLNEKVSVRENKKQSVRGDISLWHYITHVLETINIYDTIAVSFPLRGLVRIILCETHHRVLCVWCVCCVCVCVCVCVVCCVCVCVLCVCVCVGTRVCVNYIYLCEKQLKRGGCLVYTGKKLSANRWV